jgi:hypothetical protein
MPEEISAHITIGGGIPRELVCKLCQTICLERVGRTGAALPTIR